MRLALIGRSALLVALCFGQPIAAQQAATGIVEISVQESMGMVEGFLVRSVGRSATTDADGKAQLTLPAGRQSISLTRVGFVPRQVAVVSFPTASSNSSSRSKCWRWPSANTPACSGSAEGTEQLRTFERWIGDVSGRGRIELVAELVRPVYIRHELDSTRTVTAAAYAAEISAVRRALPSVQFEIHDCALIGDRLWARWTMTGTSAATGGAVRRMGMQTYRFDSGQLAETWMLMPPTDAVWPDNWAIGKPTRPAAAESLTGGITEAVAQAPPVTVVIVRHPESAGELTAVGRQRAELLVQTLRDTRFTHVFATHTTRARQTVEPIATVQNLQVVQLPAPGSMLAGQTVTDATSRQAAIAPIADAVLQLPAGSVVLIGANSDNVYGILNRLGVPVAGNGQECAAGSMCVPCLTNACFPGSDFDRLWHLVIEAGQAKPIVLIQTRYGAGWSPPK